MHEKFEEYLAQFKNLKLKEFSYNPQTNTLRVIILHADGQSITNKQEIENKCKEIIDEDCNFIFDYKKAYMDAEELRKQVKAHIAKKYGFISLEMEDGDLQIKTQDNYNYEIVLHLPSHTISFVDLKKPLAEFLDVLHHNYFENFELIVVEKKNCVAKTHETDANQRLKEYLENTDTNTYSVNKVQKVTGIESYIGKPIYSKPIKLKFAKASVEYQSFAGSIEWLRKKEFVKKEKDGSETPKAFWTFALKFGKDIVNCVFFPNQTTYAKFEKLVDGTQVLCGGIYEEYNGRSSLKVRDISFCQVVEEIESEPQVVYKDAAKAYRVVFPEECSSVVQVGLVAEKTEICKELLEGTFVVFDLETTGFNWSDGDKIVEIGAVKIVGGKVVQKFNTLVNPQKQIPQDSTRVHGITDSMVANSPKIEDVIPDFYKFCEGATLVAHNGSGFDIPFIQYAARACGYNFDHKNIDTLILAQQKIKGVRNYKLGSLAKHLNINMERAHRAGSDVTATAELFIKLLNLGATERVG